MYKSYKFIGTGSEIYTTGQIYRLKFHSGPGGSIISQLEGTEHPEYQSTTEFLEKWEEVPSMTDPEQQP